MKGGSSTSLSSWRSAGAAFDDGDSVFGAVLNKWASCRLLHLSPYRHLPFAQCQHGSSIFLVLLAGDCPLGVFPPPLPCPPLLLASKVFWSWLYSQSFPFLQDFLMKWKWQGIFFFSRGLALRLFDFPFLPCPFPLACCFGWGEGSTGAASDFALGFGAAFSLALAFAFALAFASGGAGAVGVGAVGLPPPAKSLAYFSLAATCLSSLILAMWRSITLMRYWYVLLGSPSIHDSYCFMSYTIKLEFLIFLYNASRNQSSCGTSSGIMLETISIHFS